MGEYKDWDDGTIIAGDKLSAAQFAQMVTETQTTSGDTTIAAGNISKVVTHGFGATPKHVYLEVISSMIVGCNAPLSGRNATTFTIYLEMDQDSDVNIRWTCKMEV